MAGKWPTKSLQCVPKSACSSCPAIQTPSSCATEIREESHRFCKNRSDPECSGEKCARCSTNSKAPLAGRSQAKPAFEPPDRALAACVALEKPRYLAREKRLSLSAGVSFPPWFAAFCATPSRPAANRSSASLLLPRALPPAADKRSRQRRLVARFQRSRLFDGGIALAAEAGFQGRRPAHRWGWI